MIEEAIVTLVNNATGIMPEPAHLQQEPTLPAITYQRISAVRDYTQQGANGKSEARFQLNLWGEDESYLQLLTLANQLRIGMNGYRGVIGTTRIDKLFLVNQIDSNEPATGRLRVIMDFMVDHLEEVT